MALRSALAVVLIDRFLLSADLLVLSRSARLYSITPGVSFSRAVP